MTPTLTGVEHVDVDLVDPHPKNPRRDLGDLAELTASIKTDGVRNPIHVAPDGDRYVVLAGHRRRQAAIAAGLDRVPVIIREDVGDDAAALVEMLVENLLRADLTPIEEATAYEQLRIAGVRAPQIAKRTGRKRATVDARLALMKLPEDTRDKVHARQLSLADAAAMLEFASDRKRLTQLERAAGTSNFDWTLQSMRRDRDLQQRKATVLADLQASGTTVLDAPPPSHWDKHLRNVVVLEGDQEDPDAARRAAHADCPHHAAYIDQYGGQAVYVCLKPSVHKPDGADVDAEDSAQAAARAAEDDERKQAAANAETAAAVRRAFVVDVITGRRGIPAGAADAIALAAAKYSIRAYCETPVDQLAGWLELALPEAPEKGGYEARRAHEEANEGLALDALHSVGGQRALLAVLAEWSDGPLVSWHSWQPSSEDMRAGSNERTWLALLQLLGYELTEWEATAIAAADQWAVDNPDADATPDGE